MYVSNFSNGLIACNIHYQLDTRRPYQVQSGSAVQCDGVRGLPRDLGCQGGRLALPVLGLKQQNQEVLQGDRVHCGG